MYHYRWCVHGMYRYHLYLYAECTYYCSRILSVSQ